jgi:hypothetical protein
MTLDTTPPSLQTLSLQVISKKITTRGLQLIQLALSHDHVENVQHVHSRGRKRKRTKPPHSECRRNAAISDEVMSTVETVCKQVKDFLLTNIPSLCADDVAREIIKQFTDERYQIFHCSHCTHADYVFRKFIAAILNSNVRNLDLSRTSIYIAHCVTSELQAAPNLKVFKFIKHDEYNITHYPVKYCRVLPISNFFKMRKLEFSFFFFWKPSFDVQYTSLADLKYLEDLTLQRVCTNDILENLSHKCSQIKSLDISGSWKVDRNSIESIKRFKHLKMLDISLTNLTALDHRTILKCFSNSGDHPLEFYGCTVMECDFFSKLMEFCPSIRGLSIHLIDVEPVPSKARFQNMSFLRIYSCITDMNLGHLVKCAPHLEELEVKGAILDFKHIMDNCPSLKRLSITTRRLNSNVTTHTAFSSIQHLNLRIRTFLDSAQLIAKCKNLRTLELFTGNNMRCRDMSSILFNNPLTCLKEISLGITVDFVPEDVVTLFYKHCPNLAVFKVVLSKIYNPKYKDCPGIIIECDPWREIERLAFPFL